MQPQQGFTVTPIGTCRIANALAVGQQDGRYRVDTAKVYGYVHCTKDIIQQIRFMLGELDIPDELAPFICNPGKPLDRRLAPPASQLYLVEISSLKEFAYGGYYLQLNHLFEHFADRHELLRIVFRNRTATRLGERAVQLAANPGFDYCTALEQDILLNAIVNVQDFSGVLEDLKLILAMFSRPPVVVTHCDVAMQGKAIESRRRLIEYLRTASRLLGFELFEPTPLIRHYGQEFAMAKGGQDTAHYSPAFEAILGDELCERYVVPRLALAG